MCARLPLKLEAVVKSLEILLLLGGFASVKTAIAESVYDCYCWRLVKEAEVLLRNRSCVRRVRLP